MNCTLCKWLILLKLLLINKTLHSLDNFVKSYPFNLIFLELLTNALEEVVVILIGRVFLASKFKLSEEVDSEFDIVNVFE